MEKVGTVRKEVGEREENEEKEERKEKRWISHCRRAGSGNGDTRREGKSLDSRFDGREYNLQCMVQGLWMMICCYDAWIQGLVCIGVWCNIVRSIY